MVIVLAAVTIPYLPPGISFSDAGDLQLASATLGIMHAPGYAGYVTLGYLVTRVPGVDPAYMVSLACLAAGIIALTLCMLIQVRLGVNPWAASALVLALTAHSRVWKNLVIPEVYAPSLAFLLGAVYLLVKYARIGRRRDLFIAAALFGIALANRPTVVWTLPFFILAWWLARARWDTSRGRSARTFLWITLCGALPGLYSLGYLWVRDAPTTLHNYLDEHNAENHVLPEVTDGTRAKLKRLWYQVSAREFKRFIGNTWWGAWKRLDWIYKEFFLYQPVRFVIVLFMLGSAAAITFSRCRCSFTLLMGLAFGNAAFICTYNIYGQAADLLPLMCCATVLAGVAVSTLLPAHGTGLRRWTGIVLLLGMCVVTVWHAPQRRTRKTADASRFLAGVNMKTLPQDAVICSTWGKSTPLWYAKYVLTKRHDVDIINTTTNRWMDRVKALPDRPVFVVAKASDLERYTLTPFRAMKRGDDEVTVLWHVDRTSSRDRQVPES